MIPDGWLSITLGQVCKEKIKTGPFGSQLHAHEYVESGIPVIMPKDLLNGNIIIDKAAKISQEKADVLSKHKLENGDLIFSRRGNVTCAAIVKTREVGCICGTGCLRVRLDKNCVSPPFLNALIQNESVKDWLESNAVGQTMLNLNTTILSNLPIQIPPLSEQCKIAEILGVWDEAIDLLEKLVVKTRSRKQGLMQQLLTGKKRFKEFEGSEWKTVKLIEVAEVIVSPVDKLTVDGEIAILLCNYTHVYHNIRITKALDFMMATATEREIARFALLKGDVIITKDSETPNDIAVPAYVSEDLGNVICGYHLSILRPNKNEISGEYLNYLLSTPEIRYYFFTLANGATRFGLSVGSIEKAQFNLPPLPEQEKIAAVLSAADEEIATLEKQLAAYKRQKIGLMQQLLTGRTRI